jgi:hypothetical protein
VVLPVDPKIYDDHDMTFALVGVIPVSARCTWGVGNGNGTGWNRTNVLTFALLVDTLPLPSLEDTHRLRTFGT